MVKTSPAARRVGTRVGFAGAATIFLFVLNGLSYYATQGFRRGLLISAAAVLLISIVAVINRRHKKWVW